MTAVTRIEVILAEALLQPFVEVVEARACRAYAVSTGLSGGSRSGRATVGLSDAIVTIVCTRDEAATMVAGVEAFLRRYGGTGCVTEGQGLNVDG